MSGGNILKFMFLFNNTPTEQEQNDAYLLPTFPPDQVHTAINAGRKLAEQNFPKHKPQQLVAVSPFTLFFCGIVFLNIFLLFIDICLDNKLSLQTSERSFTTGTEH
jgi:hypothetical protein